MKNCTRRSSTKNECHFHKAGRALLVADFLRGIGKEHAEVGMWYFIISSLLNLLVYTYDLCVYNSGKSHSLNTIWYSDYDRCMWKTRRQ